MQRYLRIAAIISILCPHYVMYADGAKALKKKELTSLAREGVSLSKLTDLAQARPEYTAKFWPSIVSEDDVLYFLEKTVAIARQDLLSNALWFHGKTPYDKHFFNTSMHTKFKPFMQKTIVPTSSTLFFWGDTHGCIHSLLRTLNHLREEHCIDDNFKIIKPNTYLIYLGDCVDKGRYGLEVLYTLMRLKTANPDHVILVRGNHEDAQINRIAVPISFDKELTVKQFRHRNRLYRLYDMMPPIVYIGSGNQTNRSYMMCCHGGLEIGITPTELITAPDDINFMALTTLHRADMIKALPADMQEAIERTIPPAGRRNSAINTPRTHHFGYMYSNFLIDDSTKIVGYIPPCNWIYGKELTRTLLERDGGSDKVIKSILRAHQHIGMMQQELSAHQGYFSLWDGMVRTVLSAPAIELVPPCPYDSLVKVVTAEQWKDWKFTHLSHPMPS